MIIKRKEKGKHDRIRNTDKPWIIESCYKLNRYYENEKLYGYIEYHWDYWKSYKTFEDVINAWCDLKNNWYGRNHYWVWRINKTDFK